MLHSITYILITPESAENGDYAEAGFDTENETLTFSELVSVLRNGGFSQDNGDGMSFSTPGPDRNMYDGSETYRTLHLDRNPQSVRKWVKLAYRLAFRR
jgi:hypothetical protein